MTTRRLTSALVLSICFLSCVEEVKPSDPAVFRCGQVIFQGDGWIYLERQLPQLLPTDGYDLWVGATKSGLPAEAFSKLVVTKNGTAQIIVDTAGLKGFVSIATAEEALSLCRLFTDSGTHYLFEDSPGLEVFNESASKQGLYDTRKTTWCVITSSSWRRLGLSKPIVQKYPTCFIVERTIMSYGTEQSGWVLYRSIERVGFDGSYAHRVKKVIRRKPWKYGIFLPMYR